MHDIDAALRTPGRQPERRRPPLITAASGLLAAGGALLVGEVLLSADEYFTAMEVYEQAVSDGVTPNHGMFAAVGVVLHLTLAAVGVITGSALVVLAVFIHLGKRWARTVSRILGVPVLLHGTLAALAFLGTLIFSGAGGPVPPELTRRYEQAWPSWLHTLDIVLIILVSVALLTGLACHTTPSVDAYFRDRSATPAGQWIRRR